jgi:3'-phosphoadenosine 5'-phosphosulfate sulfotransferase (PAPS reductase)/FAD synthetase
MTTTTLININTAVSFLPDLTSYDVILVNSSAGKDSQAMLDYLVSYADRAGVRDRMVVVHSDLGDRVEWAGTRELAEEQAAHYGIRFEVVTRNQGDLLTQVEERGMWPSNGARYCTSDHKRAQVRRVMTMLTDEIRIPRTKALADRIGREYGFASKAVQKKQLAAAKRAMKPVRILNCMGLRADESPNRAKKLPFSFDDEASNGRRHVDECLPIHGWTEAQVWARIKLSGVRYHYAYDLGMPRLSCMFCIFGPEWALAIAGKANPARLGEYVRVEKKIDHTFKADYSLASLQEKLEAGVTFERGEKWSQCA